MILNLLCNNKQSKIATAQTTILRQSSKNKNEKIHKSINQTNKHYNHSRAEKSTKLKQNSYLTVSYVLSWFSKARLDMVKTKAVQGYDQGSLVHGNTTGISLGSAGKQ